ELGGAKMHASISGTIDFREPNDEACIERLKRLVGMLPDDSPLHDLQSPVDPIHPAEDLRKVVDPDGRKEYDLHDVLNCIIDAGEFDEYKAEFGQTMICGFARIGGHAIGIVGNQRKRSKHAKGQLQYGGVIYVDSADKAARFIMDCNQM